MSSTEIKQLLFIILLITINLVISFLLTYFLGITNTAICHPITSIINEITYEMIIFMILVLIESSIYEVS